MTTVAAPSLKNLWAETRGSDVDRTVQLLKLVQTRGVPLGDATLARVLDLAKDSRYDRIAAMFTDAPSSTRPHDIATQGMRAGGFASVRRDVDVRREPEASVALTQRDGPTPLAFLAMFAQPGRLSEAQRDWVETGSGRRPRACGISSAGLIEPFTRDFLQLTLRLWSERRSEDGPSAQHERLLQCALDNLHAPSTTATFKSIAKADRLDDIFAARRALVGLEGDVFSSAREVPELRELPHEAWANILATANVAAPIREDLGHIIDAGRLDLATAYCRVLGRYGPTPQDVRSLTAASLVQTGAYAIASKRLDGARAGTPLATLRAALANDAPHIGEGTLRALERDGHSELVGALRKRGVSRADGSLTLTPPKARSADELIAAGRRLLSPELIAAGRESQRLLKQKQSESPPTRATSEAYERADTVLVGHMRKLASDLLAQRGDEGGDQGYAVLADSIDCGKLIKDTYVEVPDALRDAFRWTSGRGVAAFDRIDAAADNSFFDRNVGSIELVSVGQALEKNLRITPRRDVFHEVGHAAECSDPGLGAACREWRDRRATGGVVTHGAGTEGEYRAVPGPFVSPYVGKIYPNGDTEVLSVGLQHFTGPSMMAGLYEADPEHFCFILGWLES